MAAIVCPACSHASDSGARFCNQCGLELAQEVGTLRRVCAGCRTVNDSSFHYCYHCGLELPERLYPHSQVVGDPAGLWVRALAAAIDGGLLLLAGGLAAVVLPGDAEGWPFALVAALLIAVVYYTLTVGRWGQTAGKRLLGLRVVRADGSPATYLQSFARCWAYALSILPLGLGVLAIALSTQKRGWHDLISGTRVLRVGF
jgi:uncharacterized RDD family membrane protein YckC